MSEIAAIYAHLDAVDSENPINSSIEAFFADLTTAGFDLDSALTEIANLDSRLSELANLERVTAYARTNKLETIEHLVTALSTNYPGSLQEIANYCFQKNSELSAVSGGRSGVLNTSMPTGSKSRLQSRLGQISNELEARKGNLEFRMELRFIPYDGPRKHHHYSKDEDIPE